eukprot:tig00021257_g19764.t1
MKRDGKGASSSSNDDDEPGAADLRRGRSRLSASIDAAEEAADASSPIAMLPDELLMQILRLVARELPSDEEPYGQCRCRWPAALCSVNELRAVCKRFKSAMDAAGGPLALFESAWWGPGVERWLAGCPGGVHAFLADQAPRLTGLRDVAVGGGGQYSARFLAAIPSACWPSLSTLRIPCGFTGELDLRACSDALAAVPTAKLSLRSFEVNVGRMLHYDEEASALLGTIVRRCAPSLRSLNLTGIVLDGRWEDLFPVAGLRELGLGLPPRPVALGGLERSGAAATLETLVIQAGDPLSGPGGRDSAVALAALPALSSFINDTSHAGIVHLGWGSEWAVLPPLTPGSFPSLRSLTLRGPSTRSDWWAAALASPAGARLESLSLEKVNGAGRLVESLQASGRPHALHTLRLSGCPLPRADAARLLGFAAGLPALHTFTLFLTNRKEDADGVVQLPPAPEGSFPALRHLSLSAPSTPCGWWAAALASGSGARLESLKLGNVAEAWRALAALQAPGPPLALHRLSLSWCRLGSEEAPRLAGLLAACPALKRFFVRGCDELEKFLAGGGDAEAAGPRLLRELEARGVDVDVEGRKTHTDPPSPIC